MEAKMTQEDIDKKVRELGAELSMLRKAALADGLISKEEIARITKSLNDIEILKTIKDGRIDAAIVVERLKTINVDIISSEKVFDSIYAFYEKTLSADANKIVYAVKKIQEAIVNVYMGLLSHIDAFLILYVHNKTQFNIDRAEMLKKKKVDIMSKYEHILSRVQVEGETSNQLKVERNNNTLTVGGIKGNTAAVEINKDGKGGKIGGAKGISGDRTVAASISFSKEEIGYEVGVSKSLWEIEFPSIPIFGPVFTRLTSKGSLEIAGGQTLNLKEGNTKTEAKVKFSATVGLELFASGGIVEVGGKFDVGPSFEAKVALICNDKRKVYIEHEVIPFQFNLTISVFLQLTKELREAAKKFGVDQNLLKIDLPLGTLNMFIVKYKPNTPIEWDYGKDFDKLVRIFKDLIKELEDVGNEIRKKAKDASYDLAGFLEKHLPESITNPDWIKAYDE